jgi:hypothetical protein
MASPQLEQGAISIAHDLYLAINRTDFTSLESRTIFAVIYLTYGAGKTKAEIRPEDIRYLLGAEKKLRTDRIEETITRLISRGVLFKQALTNGSQLLGLQKDYEVWDTNNVTDDKMSPSTLVEDINTKSSPVRVGDILSPPERLLAYAQKKGNFTYGKMNWRVERKYAKQLYIEALSHTRDPLLALYLLKDCLDTQDEWFYQNVKMQFTFLSSRFKAWYSQIPRKPREVAENEQATGKRWRYHVKLKHWEEAR